MSKTLHTVHIGPNDDRDDATLCSPSGMMRDLAGGGWSGGVRFTQTTREVTCQSCLRSLAAKQTAAIKLNKTNGVEPVRVRFVVQRQAMDGTWSDSEDWGHKARARKEMDDTAAWLLKYDTCDVLAMRVVHSITREVLASVQMQDAPAPAAVETSPAPEPAATPAAVEISSPAAAPVDTDASADVVPIGSAGSLRAGVLSVVPDLPATPADPPTVTGCEVDTVSAGMNRVRALCRQHNNSSGYTPPTAEAARLAFRCDGGRAWRFLVSWDDDLVDAPPQPPRLEALTLTHNWLCRQLRDRPYDVVAGRAIHIRLWVAGAEFIRLSVVRDTRADVDPGGYLLVGPDGTTYTAVHRNELD